MFFGALSLCVLESRREGNCVLGSKREISHAVTSPQLLHWFVLTDVRVRACVLNFNSMKLVGTNLAAGMVRMFSYS